MSVSKCEPILIVGGGAFGLSTVVHLLKAGYKDITVLDKDDEIPSRWSAANDLNKIVRAEYEDPLYQDLTVVSANIVDTPEISFGTNASLPESDQGLANAFFCSPFPPSRLPSLCLRQCAERSARHPQPFPYSCRARPSSQALFQRSSLRSAGSAEFPPARSPLQ